MTIAPDTDGRHHPATQAEVQALVAYAYEHSIPVRVTGAGLSTPKSVHNDGDEGVGPPPPGVFEIVLDRLRRVRFEEEHDGHAIVAAEAGCLLGRQYDDPEGTSWPTTLTYLLQEKGYALPLLGGISHQSVGGMLMTGSAGGSVRHSLHDSVQRLLLCDGTGRLHDLRRDDPDPAGRDRFFAVGVSMGLCGVLLEVWLRVEPRYDVVGSELGVRLAEAPVDLLGKGDGTRPNLEKYLTAIDYARFLWWPQHGFERVQLWHADRITAQPGFVPLPYELMNKRDSLLGSLLVTILGNLDDLSAVPAKLESWNRELARLLDGHTDRAGCPRPRTVPPVSKADVLLELRRRLGLAVKKHPRFHEGDGDEDVQAIEKERGAPPHGPDWSDSMAGLMVWAIERVLEGGSGMAIGAVLKRLLPEFIDELLGIFVQDGEKQFRDSWMCGLPMDNQMEEALWRTDFTELWIPLERAAEVVQAMHHFYAAGGDVREAYARTGPFTVELYAGAPSDFWMNPGHGGPCLRINVFWFHKWAGSPRDARYPALWNLLEPFGFRPHWGKHLPGPSERWRAHYRRYLPKLDAFLKVRAELDPRQLFVTRYWREHLGIAPR
jgi:hypothetical protein